METKQSIVAEMYVTSTITSKRLMEGMDWKSRRPNTSLGRSAVQYPTVTL